VTFRDHKGNDIKTVEGNEGDDLLSLAHEYDVDLEGGFLLLRRWQSERRAVGAGSLVVEAGG
jgi:hypothetical protein